MAKRRPKLTTLMNASEFPSSPSWSRIIFPTRRPFDFSHEIKIEKTRERKMDCKRENTRGVTMVSQTARSHLPVV